MVDLNELGIKYLWIDSKSAGKKSSLAIWMSSTY